MKRRTALFGLGVLASGSGAIATSAAIANSVSTTSQLAVVVDEQLKVRAGQAFNDDGSVKSGYTDRYVAYESKPSFFDDSSDGLDDIDADDPPIATVNRRDQNINNDVKVITGISIENNKNDYYFENILKVENYGGKKQRIGISYDRSDNTYDPNGQYGEAVDTTAAAGDPALSPHDVQSVYRFEVNNDDLDEYRISPDESNGGSDDPARYYSLQPGETVQLDLRIDLTPYFSGLVNPKENIEAAADTSPTFTRSTDSVDMLDAITVVRDS